MVSNCVINLTPFKDQVFSEIYRVLKPGGELYFSDVFCDRRMSDELRADPVLRGECLGGAMYIDDFRRMLAKHGWKSYVCTAVEDIHVSDLALETKLGFTSFTSRTVRAIKAEGLEDAEENYGQVACYLGGMPEMPRYFDLTEELRLIKGREYAVSGNLAAMLEQSRYGKYFEVTPRGAHRGGFDLARAQQALEMRRGKRKADLDYLNEACERCGIPSFYDRVNLPEILQASERPATMQVNITYACNLACRHCYLECGPRNNEVMSRETMERILAAFKSGGYKTLDVTGGSPELHPDCEWFLREGAKLAEKVIVRTNLTLEEKPEYEHFLDVFAEVGGRCVRVASVFRRRKRRQSARTRRLQARRREHPQAQRARVWARGRSRARDRLQRGGLFLPPPQEFLTDAYRVKLTEQQGIDFNELYAFNNFPLGRFAMDLADAGTTDDYLKLLHDNFNAFAVGKIMCRDQVNVDVDGRLYDCECNHVLEMPIQLDGRDATIADIVDVPLPPREVRTNPVCYSCASGAGSSCGGSLIQRRCRIAQAGGRFGLCGRDRRLAQDDAPALRGFLRTRAPSRLIGLRGAHVVCAVLLARRGLFGHTEFCKASRKGRFSCGEAVPHAFYWPLEGNWWERTLVHVNR